ncbi:SDR family oxidoreductase [Sphingobacterium sp. JB170]|uniref:SDR family oxidoreductase n=1 Tax=Sphingobacterium sp. JB170 TaxID=1434842 RepID=UPI00097EBB4E|nr:SDR family oxidoreductase [Sphingobacterium sp. JB170]SJN21091.1 2,4-dienoyl-CoA reductase, mitochondrial precursor [Sphingobacterium sp. JB170]
MVEGALKENALLGKTIVVTGGGTGLGKAMATYFSQLGANLVLTSRKLDVLEKTAQEITANTGNAVLAVSCDIREIAQVESLLKQSIDRFSRVDMLVNNAAGNFISPSERLSANAFSTVIDIVLKGTVNCTLTFGKDWIAKKQQASVLNIVTTYASTGSGFVVPSAIAKSGVLTLTRSLAVEWGKYGIRQNAIAPGPFPTKGAWDRLLPGELLEKFDFKNRVPLKRVGDHQELSNLAAFLLSDYATFINGEVVTIDGGEWLQGAGQFNSLEAIPQEMWDSIESNIRKTNKS